MAMKVAAVYRCVDILSSGVAMLPFEKKRYNRAQEYFMTDRSDRTNYLIKVKPNRHMTSYELKRNAVIQLLMYGNAYIIPHKAHGQVSAV
jgi:phage portal protein BeeE